MKDEMIDDRRNGDSSPFDKTESRTNPQKDLIWGEQFSSLLELVLAKDGATCHPLSLETVPKRVAYSVGIEGTDLKLPITRVSDLRSVRRVEVESIRLSALRDSVNLGFWIDSGVIWVEHSTLFDDLGEAIRLAEDTNQEAIYDHWNGLCRFGPDWD